ncbi:uncharacterized protein STEHIDRAFT_137465 [Stereum hirsutum FP-91666 SS1]|uniref:uncharacterized protein n=1 Tax=Stereum hirsutum (strain FP-91666) TaxID=721885 RepID=UPI0004410257|nr:uncharacterized protein STEHIDRAFT_137465 [Stereum hirsutum FP-91666 SS1]EIM89807.1 hypothetical protein STEHIDRAFT_137465 [Stereum hirsutum FP-91666 SS1]
MSANSTDPNLQLDKDLGKAHATARSLETEIVALVVETGLYGAFIVLLLYAAHILRRKQPRTWAHTAMFLTSVLMFLMSSTLWSLDIVNIILPMRQIFDKTEAGIEKSYSNLNQIRWFWQSFVFTLEFVVGDSVVTWRACSLWNYQKRVVLPFVISLVACTVTAFVYVGCVADNDWNYLKRPASCQNMETASFYLSLAINGLATFAIAFKAWQFRKDIRNFNPGPGRSNERARRWTFSERIILLLIESGMIYLAIWLSKLYTYIRSPSTGTLPGEFAVSVLNSMGNQVVGLYPTIIIVLVHQKRTLWDVSNISWTTPTLDTTGSPGQIQAGSRSWAMRQVSEVGNQTSVVTTMRFGDGGEGEGEGSGESEQDSEVRSGTDYEVREEAEKRLA